MTGFGFFDALKGIGPIWELFTSWHAFSHLVVGTCIFTAGLLLLRDWIHGTEERREEQWRRKLWNEERTEFARQDITSEL